jgi:DNA-binding MarR family transcriptional regulator
MADMVDRATQQIRDRLQELEPLLKEQRQLQRALEALEQTGGRRSSARHPRTTTTRPRRTKGSSRRAKRGERQEALLKAIRRNPGSRPADLARALGVAPSQAHNLLRRLQESDRVERREGGFFLREASVAQTSSSETPSEAIAATPGSSPGEGPGGEDLREQMSERLSARSDEATGSDSEA